MENARLSVLVPVFNEAPHLKEVVEHLLGSPSSLEREWIFVDDCSTDNSREILRELRERHGFLLLENETNKGKGAALSRAIQIASGNVIVIQDADFEYDPADVESLVQPIVSGAADVVFGSRFKRNALQVHRTYHFLTNRVLTLLSNLLSGIYLTDMETCYKVFRADLLKAMNLDSKRFGIEVELTAYVAKTSARLFEIPISYSPRTRLDGKKINWKDGVAALWHLVRYNCVVTLDQAFTNLPDAYLPTRNRNKAYSFSALSQRDAHA